MLTFTFLKEEVNFETKEKKTISKSISFCLVTTKENDLQRNSLLIMDRHSLSRYCSVGLNPIQRFHFVDKILQFRTSTNDEIFSSNYELINYVHECFWPRISACTIRLIYLLRDSSNAHRHIERQWTLQVFDELRIDFVRSFGICFS